MNNDTLPEWDLGDLYQGIDCPELERDFNILAQRVEDFEDRYKGKLTNAKDSTLLACVEDYQSIIALETRVLSYASLMHVTDLNNPELGKFSNDCRERITQLTKQLVFLESEICEIEESTYCQHLDSNPALARYRQFLDQLRKLKPHILSPDLEKFAKECSILNYSWIRLFDETIAAITCNVEGENLTLVQTLEKLNHKNRGLREKSAKALANEFGKRQSLFTLVINTLAKSKAIEDEWRSFDSPQSARHLANNIDGSIIDSLRRVIVESYPDLSHRYYKMKSQWLELDRLQIWDRSAPLPFQSDKKFSWEEAQDIVRVSFRDFSTEMASIAELFFTNPWIHAPIRIGKASGAFSHPTVTDVHPYILLNYTGQPRDVMILAHELGHGIHQILASKQGELLADTPLTLAETASVFAEMLTFDNLLGSAGGEIEQKALIAGKVEDMINTVARQISFYDFESRLHTSRVNGELTSDEIGKIWMDNQKECLGPAFEFMDGYKTFWSYIPHFIHAPFYVYAYAFGQGLVHGLYSVYRDNQEGFADKYMHLLKAGGSKRYDELLAQFDFDLSDSRFWERTVESIAHYIDLLEDTET